MNTQGHSTLNSISGFVLRAMRVAAVALMLITAGQAAAQSRESTDMDHPVWVRSNEITGQIGNKEIFYTFVAGPGELTMTLDLVQQDVGATVEVILADKDANKITSFYGWSLGHNARRFERITFPRKQQVNMIINIYHAGIPYNGTFRLRFAGAIELPQSAPPPSPGPTSNGSTMRICDEGWLGAGH